MTANQIGELLLDLYDARPEAKEYLEFFINPDIDSKLEKARTAIKKELMRASRGRNKARSTRIRRTIRDIASLNPGPEAVCEIMTYSVVTACAVGSGQWIKDTTQSAIARLMHDTLAHADRHGLLDVYLPRIRSAVEAMPSTPYYSREFKKLLTSTLEDTLHDL